MHPAKLNFRKMHSNNLYCSYGCLANEDQRHLFQECSRLDSKDKEDVYDLIFQNTGRQKKAVSAFIQIERRRKEINSAEDLLNNNILPEGT